MKVRHAPASLIVLLTTASAVAADAPAVKSLEPDCAALQAMGIDRQANQRAAELRARCGTPDIAVQVAPAIGGSLARPIVPAPASLASRVLQMGGLDVNTVTGGETSPNVTQSESMVWGNGNTIVVTMNDSRNAPGNYSGIAYSTDGGTTFTRILPSPFASGHGTNYGDPNHVYNARLGKWYAAFLATGCGGQGLGVWESVDGITWTTGACAHSGSFDDRNSMWVDNNPGSPYYGRMYISWNDFGAGQRLYVVRSDDGITWSAPAQVSATFIRNIQMTGSPGTDGTVFVAGMDEGGGGTAPRQNLMYRSTDGGVTWTSVTMGATFAGPGNISCGGYFMAVSPIWRHMGWGQPAAGPNGVIHYNYCQHGTAGSDEGDIMYQRSTDNGLTWSTPIKLNTDVGDQSQWMPSLQVSANGQVLASWYDRRNTTNGSNYEFWGRVSVDNGATWLPDDRISDVLSAQPAQPDPNVQPCYAGDYNYHMTLGNTALITWCDGRNQVAGGNQQDVYFDKIQLCNVSLAPPALPNGTLGVAYSQTLTMTGGAAPYTYLVTAGSLPTGLNLASATGVLSGTPTALGTFAFTVTATDSIGCPATRSYLVSITPPGCPSITIAPGALPNATAGTAYSQTLTASGGSSPYTYAVTLGSLPAGLTLAASTGVLSGTPTAGGSSSFTVTATDSIGCPGNQAYNLYVCQLVLAPATLPGGAVGASYSQTLTTTGGTGPYTYALTSGALPPGLALSSAGVISGTPTVAGTFPFSVSSTDNNACVGVASYTIATGVVTSLCRSPNSPIPDLGTVSDTMTVAATGNVLDLNVRIQALHTFVGDLRFTLSKATPPTSVIVMDRPTNGSGGCGSDNVNATLDDEAAISVQGQCSPTPPAINGTFIPANSLGAFDGLAANGNWTFTIQDLAGIDVGTFQQWCLDIVFPCPAITVSPATLPGGAPGVAYSQTITASGGTAPYTYSVLSGALPTGLSLAAATGVLSGTPTAGGTFSFTVLAADSTGCSGSQPYQIVIGCPAITLLPATLPGGTVGAAYSQTITASGGTAPYTYAVTAGTLPAGLTLAASTGVLSGTPTAAGTSAFDVTATDAVSCTGTQSYSITVTCTSITLSPATLPGGTAGTAYSQTITASGGTAPYTYAVTAGALPGGLTLNAGTGVLSGTPSAAGTFNFDVTATDAVGCTGTRSYTVVVSACTVTITPATLPGGVEGLAYSQTLTATGGTAPYTFAVTGGALPAGMSLSAGGVLSGSPTTAGTSSFTVTATDAGACSGSQAYTLVVGPAVDFVVGEGHGATNTNMVRVYKRDNTAAGTSFQAYGAGAWGTNVATGDVNGAIYGEILTGPGPGPLYSQVRGFLRNGTPIAKINFFAYGTLRYGVNVASGDLDADGYDEMLSGAGPGEVFGPHVRGWNFDNTGLAAISKISFYAYGTLKYGVNVGAGGIDADGWEEILTGPGPGGIFNSNIRGFNFDGATVALIPKVNFVAFGPLTYGANVASGDVEDDGFAEIAVTPGPGSTNPSRFLGFNFDGAALTAIAGYDVTPYTTLYGGRVAVADIDSDGRWDLVTGAGRDPAAGSQVRRYAWNGTALSQQGSFIPFSQAGYAYGVNVAGGGLGFY